MKNVIMKPEAQLFFAALISIVVLCMWINLYMKTIHIERLLSRVIDHNESSIKELELRYMSGDFENARRFASRLVAKEILRSKAINDSKQIKAIKENCHKVAKICQDMDPLGIPHPISNLLTN